MRLEGIDAPEPGQPFAQNSKQALSDLVLGKEIRVAGREFDDYGRLVARVFVGSQDTNLALVLGGWAWHYKRHSRDPTLARAEIAARSAKRGLWADPSPTAPWDFRRSGSRPRVSGRAPVETAPATDAAGSAFRGNTSSRVYHSSECPNFNCRNCTAVFKSRDAASAAGYRPGGCCRP